MCLVRRSHAWPALVGLLWLGGCWARGPAGEGRDRTGPGARRAQAVVVYVSLDEPYASPVFEAFTRDLGIPVRPVFDSEAHKSRGLAQRLLSERNRPRADVFWSSEVLQMVRLAAEGVLDPYRCPTAEGIPARYRDPQDRWVGFAGRFRVLACNPQRLREEGLPLPKSLLELTHPRWKGKTALANPLFGTTTTEAAALFQVLGRRRAEEYFRARAANDPRVVDGNSPAAEAAARGDVPVAQTDTDDAYVRQAGGAALEVVFPDQDTLGALLIPNTAAAIRDGPSPQLARQFLDYLLRPETELMLAALPSRQLPLHPGLEDRLPATVRPLARVRVMDVDYSRLAEQHWEMDALLRELFLR